MIPTAFQNLSFLELFYLRNLLPYILLKKTRPRTPKFQKYIGYGRKMKVAEINIGYKWFPLRAFPSLLTVAQNLSGELNYASLSYYLIKSLSPKSLSK